MENNLKDFDDVFREEFSDYAETPPPAVWQTLERRLEHNKKRRIFPLRWFWYFSIISAITLLGASLLWNNIRNSDAANVLASTDVADASENGNNTISAPNPTTAEGKVKPKNVVDNNEDVIDENAEESGELTPASNKLENTENYNKHNKYNRRSKDIKTTTYAKTTQSHAYQKQEEITTERTTLNAATTGTSAYSYDDFENETATTESMQPGASMPVDDGKVYVQKKAKRGKIIVAESVPEPTPVSQKDYLEEVVVSADDAIVTTNSKQQKTTSENINNTRDNEYSMAVVPGKKAQKKVITRKAKKGASAKAITDKTISKSGTALVATVASPAVIGGKSTAKNTVTAQAGIAMATTNVTKISASAHTPERATPGVAAGKAVRQTVVTNNSNTTVAKRNYAMTTATKEKTIPQNTITAGAMATAPETEVAMVAKEKSVLSAGTHVQKTVAVSKASNAARATHTMGKEKDVVSESEAVAAKGKGTSTVSATKSQQKNTTAATTKMTVPVKTVVVENTATKEIKNSTDYKAKSRAGKINNSAMENVTVKKQGNAQSTSNMPAKATAAIKANKSAKQPTAVIAKNAAGEDKHTNVVATKVDGQPTVQKSTATNIPSVSTAATIDEHNTAAASNVKKVKNISVPSTKAIQVSKQKKAAGQAIAGTAKPASGQLQSAKQNNAPVLSASVINKTNSKTAKSLAAATKNEHEQNDVPSVVKPEAAKPMEKVTEAKSPVAQAAKAAPTDTAVAPVVTNEPKEDSAKRQSKFVYGIKGGFEGSVSSGAANKMLIAPYLQYHLSDKLSLMVQPSLKLAGLRNRNVGAASSYYDVKAGSGRYTLVDSSLTVLVFTNDTLWKRNYAYTETHDSIVKTNSVGGTYVEVEFPLLLQYKLTSKLSIYGGLNTIYSKLLSVKENTTTIKDIAATGNTSTLLSIYAPAVLPNTTGITYTGIPYSAYTGPAFPTSGEGGSVRVGYMLGFSYELRKRWMADVLVQQTFVKQNIQAGYNVNRSLSVPYMRFTLGYRISK
ncbi:MAG: hypothetical protein K9G49_13600 [Taibaiella sp.]|nr:hypothetical protein [Taibaiella sp.]